MLEKQVENRNVMIFNSQGDPAQLSKLFSYFETIF